MFSVTRLPILSALDEIRIHLNWLAANSFFAFLFGLESLASSLHCGIQEPSSPGFKLSWSRVAERQNPSSKRTVPDKMNVNGIPVACLRLSQLNVKWSALRGDGAGWLAGREFAGVSPSITLLPLSSVWCRAWDNTSGWAAGSIISGGEKNGVSAQGKAAEPAKPQWHYFKELLWWQFPRKVTSGPQTTKLWVHHKFKAPFQWFWKL